MKNTSNQPDKELKVHMLMIIGKPIAKNRPRFARRGGFVTTYSDQATEEGLWILQAREELKGAEVITGPVKISLEFFLQRPKSHYRKSTQQLTRSAPHYPTGKPDLDNLVKFAQDCLNECFVWKDDSVIVEIYAKKRYCQPTIQPKTIILIEELA